MNHHTPPVPARKGDLLVYMNNDSNGMFYHLSIVEGVDPGSGRVIKARHPISNAIDKIPGSTTLWISPAEKLDMEALIDDMIRKWPQIFTGLDEITEYLRGFVRNPEQIETTQTTTRDSREPHRQMEEASLCP